MRAFWCVGLDGDHIGFKMKTIEAGVCILLVVIVEGVHCLLVLPVHPALLTG